MIKKKKFDWDEDRPDFEKTEDVKPELLIKRTEPTEVLPLCTLEVFCQLSGKRADQIAGFRRYALNQQLKPRTIPEWKQELTAFQNKPMQ
jgi:hypothetical protein